MEPTGATEAAQKSDRLPLQKTAILAYRKRAENATLHRDCHGAAHNQGPNHKPQHDRVSNETPAAGATEQRQLLQGGKEEWGVMAQRWSQQAEKVTTTTIAARRR